MSSEQSRVEQLLDLWEDQYFEGQTPDLQRLCCDCPELLPLLQEKVSAYRRMEDLLRSSAEPPQSDNQDETGDADGPLKASNRDGTGTSQRRRFAVSPHDPLEARPMSSQPQSGNVAWLSDAGLSGNVRYRFLQSHAKGGLGEVLVAWDDDLSRRVAVKRMLPSGAGDALKRKRFIREAEITCRLDHPGIVSILCVGQDSNGYPSYAMKFVTGETLADAARRRHQQFQQSGASDKFRFEREVIRPLLTRFVVACNIIAYAHSQKVIHRDIKPANIMLGEFGATYVVDWGLAKRAEEPADSPPELSTSPENLATVPAADTAVASGSETDPDTDPFEMLTHPGSILGTPAFMSPEQASGNNDGVGMPADIYSLGATLYFLLTGKAPLTCQKDATWIQRLKSGDFPSAKAIQNLTPVALDAVCSRAMAVDPAHRYSNAVELAQELERWMADEPVLAVRDTFSETLARWMRRHRQWTQAIATAIAVIAVLAVLFLVSLNEQKNIANDRSIAATQAEAKATKLAEQKSQLAAQEAQARKVADEQSQLALATLKSVVLNISRKLKTVSGASEVRQALLKTSIDGLNKVAKTLDTRTESERHLAIAHNDIGRTYLLAGNVEGTDSSAEALRHYQKANEIFTKLAVNNPDDAELQRDLSVSYEYIGDVQQQLGDLAKAEDAYLKGLLISERQIALNPKDPDLKRDVAFGYEKLGDIRIAHEKLALAREAYVRSHELYSENVRALPKNATVKRDLLVGQSKLGNIYLQEGNLEQAKEIYRQCIVTCVELENIPESGAQLRDRSLMHNKLGSVLQKQSLLDEAAAAYQEGLEIARKCLSDAPDDLTARRDLSISLSYVGDILLLQEKLEECRSHYTESLEIRRKVQATDESSQVAKIDVAQSLLRMADVELKAEKTENSREFLAEAMSILAPLRDSNLLQSAADQTLFETVEKKLNELPMPD